MGKKKRLVAKPGGKRGERVESDELLSHQTIKLTFALIRLVLNEAVADEVITSNPCVGYKLPRAAAAVDGDLDPVWTFLSQEEIERLLACADIPQRARDLYATAIYTGMRQGELWGLRWGDLIDLDGTHPACSVRKSYTGPTKAGKVRRFPLTPLALEVLKRIRDRAGDVTSEALVFPGPAGERYSEGYDGGWAARHREVTQIRPTVRFHDMRHTTASHLLMGTWGRSWSLAEIKSFLEHSSVSVTERYAHLAPNHLHALASATRTAAPAQVATLVRAEQPVYANSAVDPSSAPFTVLEAGSEGSEEPSLPLVTASGIEPPTYCLGKADETLKNQGLRGDQAQKQAHATAQAIVTLAAAQIAIPAELLQALSQSVLATVMETPGVRLAVAVAEGGDHAISRALELAEIVLAPIASSVPITKPA